MSRIFIDTNLLVYTNDDGSPLKRDRAKQVWGELLQSPDVPVISTQVLQEYYNILTRKLKLNPSDAKIKLLVLEKVETVLLSPNLIYLAIDLHATDSISFWDALIVAAAQSAGCDEVWSEDLQDGRSYGALKIRNPFAAVA